METRTTLPFVILGLLALAGALVAYFLLSLFGPIDLPSQRVTVTMRIEPVIEGNTIRIVGTTNLPDGALIDYYYFREDAINEGPGRSGGKGWQVLI